MVHALTGWICYLEGAPEFWVVTDHKAITYLDSILRLVAVRLGGLSLYPASCRVEGSLGHVAGNSNVVAVALSRNPCRDWTPPCDFLNAIVVAGVFSPHDTPCFQCPSLMAVRQSSVASGGGEPTHKS